MSPPADGLHASAQALARILGTCVIGSPITCCARRRQPLKGLLAVQKNGLQFEATVRKKEQDNPRFGFLLPWHSHHWYYR